MFAFVCVHGCTPHHTQMHTHKCTHTNTQTHTNAQTHTNTQTHTNAHTHTQMHRHTQIHALPHAHATQARMLVEGKRLLRQDATRYATYRIGIETDACQYLMRWIRSQPKALQPTQLCVTDGDGIRELTREEQERMHAGGAAAVRVHCDWTTVWSCWHAF